MQHLDKVIGLLSTVVVIVVCILSVVYVHVSTTQHKAELMAKDISTALSRGIDPITVRCAYAEPNDVICIVHTASRQGDTKVVLQPSK